jgi:hypothetical protein
MSSRFENPPTDPPVSRTSQSWLAGFISDNAKKLLAALVTAAIGGAVGGIVFWVSPLKDKLFHTLYREKAEVMLSADTLKPVEGGTFSLQIVLIPKSTIQVDKGLIRVVFDKEALSLRSGAPIFNSPSLDSPVPVPDDKGIEFLALRPGKTQIQVTLQTAHGNYSQTTSVQVMPADTSQEATSTNFTGSWFLQIGSNQGKMSLHQQDWQTIPGSYFLDNGEKGLVYAHHDGKTLGATFVRGTSSPTRWFVDETPFAANTEGFLESRGFVQLQRASATGWEPSGTKVEFYAYVKLR